MPVPSAVISVPTSCRRQHLVEARALDVQDLASQRQDRLVLAVAALLGRAAGGIALDDEELATAPDPSPGSRRACRAGPRCRARPCAASARAPCARLRARARPRRSSPMIDLRLVRVLEQELLELARDDRLRPTRFTSERHELVLRLRRELRIGQLDRQHGRQTLRACRRPSSRPSLSWRSLRSRCSRSACASAPPRKPARCVPPSFCGMLFVKQNIVSW